MGVEDVPGLDLDGQAGVDGGKEELEAAQKRMLVSATVNGGEMGGE